MKVSTVSPMATTDTATPTYPITLKLSCIEELKSGGLGLSNIAKLVRWLHSQTVLFSDDNVLFLKHPLSDQLPMVRILLKKEVWFKELVKNSCIS